MSNRVQHELPRQVVMDARNNLRDNPVQTLEAFDKMVLKLLANHFTSEELAQPQMVRGRKKDRTRGENLVDHCKGIFTRNEWSGYLKLNRVPYIIFMMKDGEWNNEPIIRREKLCDILHGVLAAIDTKGTK